MKRSDRVPAAMKPVFDGVASRTDAFCQQFLNKEYRQIIRELIAALCRKRPSPLVRGKAETWAAGVIHAIGMVNFLFDRSQTPHCKATDIQSFFGVAESTVQGKSKQIRDLMGMSQLSPVWTVPSGLGDNPLAWMVQVNGLIVDIRSASIDLQREAFRRGMIPYVPADRDADD